MKQKKSLNDGRRRTVRLNNISGRMKGLNDETNRKASLNNRRRRIKSLKVKRSTRKSLDEDDVQGRVSIIREVEERA